MFILSLCTAFAYAAVCGCISFAWYQEMSVFWGDIPAAFLVAFVAIVPGFLYMFLLSSLLRFCPKPGKDHCSYPDLTVMIPAYNVEEEIVACIESVFRSCYNGKLEIIVANDGSTDQTAEAVRKKFFNSVTLLDLPHRGKAQTLNTALEQVQTDLFVTLDSDTILEPYALRNIVNTMLEKQCAAAAGTIVPCNSRESYATRMQTWDYTVGIFGIKLLQSAYHATLVAQGAFSAYRTQAVRKAGGWQESVGEDIVLTWALLRMGYRTATAPHAFAATLVPSSLRKLLRQRRRWAQGMVEGFRHNRGLVFGGQANYKTRVLIAFSVLFPLIDAALCVFVPVGLFLLLRGSFLMFGPLTLLLLPLTLLLICVINWKFKCICKKAGCSFARRSVCGLLGYVFLYQLLLAPVCILGYLRGLFSGEKSW